MAVLVGAGPQGQWCLLESLIGRLAQIKEVAQFLEMLRDKHIALIVNSDKAAAPKQIRCSKTAAKQFFLTSQHLLNAMKQNVRAKQKVRHLEEQLEVSGRRCTCSWY